MSRRKCYYWEGLKEMNPLDQSMMLLLVMMTNYYFHWLMMISSSLQIRFYFLLRQIEIFKLWFLSLSADMWE